MRRLRNRTQAMGIKGWIMLLLAAATLLPIGAVHASGDGFCAPLARVDHRGYNACSDLVVLAPGNDTRTNLLLLLADTGRIALPAPGTPGAEDWYPRAPAALLHWAQLRIGILGGQETAVEDAGSRCVSNRGGQARFLQAIRDEPTLTADERVRLAQARAAIAETCGEPDKTADGLLALAAAMATPAGKAFATYLQATAIFYGEAPAPSRALYAALADSRQPWLREAARYMLARVDLNLAQLEAYGDYGDLDRAKVDRAALVRAEQGLGDYIRHYPRGAYVDSAKGLLRRVLYLRGDAGAAAQVYAQALASGQGRALMMVVQEIDDRLIRTDQTGGDGALAPRDPLLLAVDDLWRMREAEPDAGGEPAWRLGAEELRAQQAVFAGQPRLYGYLLAAHAYYVQRKPDEALRLLGADQQETPDNLGFSRQVLRILAAEATARPGTREMILRLFPQARAPFQRQTLELLLALHDEMRGGLERVFAADSPVRDPVVRDTLLMQVAGPQLLLAQSTNAGATAHERDVALFTLLYRSLTRGHYAEFVEQLRRLPAQTPSNEYVEWMAQTPPLALFAWPGQSGRYPCPALADVARRLAAAPNDPRAKLCLGEFLRVRTLDNFEPEFEPDAAENIGVLGRTALRFPGTKRHRHVLYEQVIADPAAPREDKAYALYRAVNCYARSGYNQCGGPGVEQAVRRRWFNRLKSEFAGTHWANALRYYW